MRAASDSYVSSTSFQKRSTSISVATSAFGLLEGEKSVTVIPDVSRPVVSTCTDAGVYVNTDGATTDTTAHTSCTAGAPVVCESAYRPSAGSSSSAPSAPNSRIRSCTAAVARARSVTSSPIIRTVHPAPNTIDAASGSAQMLYSAAWFTLL